MAPGYGDGFTYLRSRIRGSTIAVPEDSDQLLAGYMSRLKQAVPATVLTNTVLVKKTRSDFSEWIAYTPMTPDGIYWHAWYMSNRAGAGIGGPILRACVLALLNKTTSVPLATANSASSTEAQPPTTTLPTTSGAQTGTWTAPAAVGGVSGISYSTVIGDKRSYSVTVGANGRIAQRSVKAANAGVWKATVRDSLNAEIAAGKYCLPLVAADRVINMNTASVPNGIQVIPIAEGLAAGTYTVEFEVHSSNAGLRLYDGGVLAYGPLAFDGVGISGIASAATIGGVNGNLLWWAKTTVIYALPDTTKVLWKYIQAATVNGIAELIVYSAVGVEVARITHDTGGNTNVAAVREVVRDLPKGTYYLHVRVTGAMAIGNSRRIYDMGAIGADQTAAGVVGVDTFDLLGALEVPPANETGFGTNVLIGYGNNESAIECRRPSDLPGTENFVSGGHGHSTNPTNFILKADGVTIDWTGAAVGTVFLGSEIEFTFTNQDYFYTANVVMSNVDWSMRFSRRGYEPTLTTTLAADAVWYQAYNIILNAPNRDTGTRGVGGGFDRIFIDGNGEFIVDGYDNTTEPLFQPIKGAAFINEAFAVAAQQTNLAETQAVFAAIPGTSGTVFGGLFDRTDKSSKCYRRLFPNGDVGALIPAGTQLTSRGEFRVFKGDFFSRLRLP